jgi:hypothetical protein
VVVVEGFLTRVLLGPQSWKGSPTAPHRFRHPQRPTGPTRAISQHSQVCIPTLPRLFPSAVEMNGRCDGVAALVDDDDDDFAGFEDIDTPPMAAPPLPPKQAHSSAPALPSAAPSTLLQPTPPAAGSPRARRRLPPAPSEQRHGNGASAPPSAPLQPVAPPPRPAKDATYEERTKSLHRQKDKLRLLQEQADKLTVKCGLSLPLPSWKWTTLTAVLRWLGLFPPRRAPKKLKGRWPPARALVACCCSSKRRSRSAAASMRR